MPIQPDESQSAQRRLESAYKSQKPGLLARVRAAGRSLEEAEDLVHEVYAETMEQLWLVDGIRNLPAWINSLFTRRLIDLWRRDRRRQSAGEAKIASETLAEIVDGAGMDPLDGFVRDHLIDALHDAIRALPAEQRQVIEAQVFRGQSFRELAEDTGESIDTLTARKRYAMRKLSQALRHWVED